jgi:hypothetical protein
MKTPTYNWIKKQYFLMTIRCGIETHKGGGLETLKNLVGSICQMLPTVDLYKQAASLSLLGEHSTCNMATLVSAGSSLTSAV